MEQSTRSVDSQHFLLKVKPNISIEVFKYPAILLEQIWIWWNINERWGEGEKREICKKSGEILSQP